MRIALKFYVMFGLFNFLVSTEGSGLTLQVDYSYDEATDGFFASHPAARAALEAAAARVSTLITSVPGALTNDYFEGQSGDVTVGFDLNLTYQNPSTGWSVSIDMPSVPTGVVPLYVGVRELSDATLAEGAPTTVSLGISALGNTAANRQSAVTQAAAAAQAEWQRGSGPVMSTLHGPLSLDGTTVDFTTHTGAVGGQLWFDVDLNNDGATDSNAALDAVWHFDHTTPPSPTQFDFYTIALHEMLHTVGLGASQTWNDRILTGAGSTVWLGSNARALNGGSGAGLLDADLEHLSADLLSPRLTDGVLQQPLMSAVIQLGQRRDVTAMDVAFLRDIGWNTSLAPVPEPSTLALLGLTLPAWRRRR